MRLPGELSAEEEAALRDTIHSEALSVEVATEEWFLKDKAFILPPGEEVQPSDPFRDGQVALQDTAMVGRRLIGDQNFSVTEATQTPDAFEDLGPPEEQF